MTTMSVHVAKGCFRNKVIDFTDILKYNGLCETHSLNVVLGEGQMKKFQVACDPERG